MLVACRPVEDEGMDGCRTLEANGESSEACSSGSDTCLAADADASDLELEAVKSPIR